MYKLTLRNISKTLLLTIEFPLFNLFNEPITLCPTMALRLKRGVASIKLMYSANTFYTIHMIFKERKPQISMYKKISKTHTCCHLSSRDGWAEK